MWNWNISDYWRRRVYLTEELHLQNIKVAAKWSWELLVHSVEFFFLFYTHFIRTKCSELQKKTWTKFLSFLKNFLILFSLQQIQSPMIFILQLYTISMAKVMTINEWNTWSSNRFAATWKWFCFLSGCFFIFSLPFMMKFVCKYIILLQQQIWIQQS